MNINSIKNNVYCEDSVLKRANVVSVLSKRFLLFKFIVQHHLNTLYRHYFITIGRRDRSDRSIYSIDNYIIARAYCTTCFKGAAAHSRNKINISNQTISTN